MDHFTNPVHGFYLVILTITSIIIKLECSSYSLYFQINLVDLVTFVFPLALLAIVFLSWPVFLLASDILSNSANSFPSNEYCSTFFPHASVALCFIKANSSAVLTLFFLDSMLACLHLSEICGFQSGSIAAKDGSTLLGISL